MAMGKDNWQDNYYAGWVTADGSYGEGGIILFDPNKLSRFHWFVLDCLADSDKYEYVQAILAGEDLTYWESDYESERESNG
jgi:hypothetical protein